MQFLSSDIGIFQLLGCLDFLRREKIKEEIEMGAFLSSSFVDIFSAFHKVETLSI